MSNIWKYVSRMILLNAVSHSVKWIVKTFQQKVSQYLNLWKDARCTKLRGVIMGQFLWNWCLSLAGLQFPSLKKTDVKLQGIPLTHITHQWIFYSRFRHSGSSLNGSTTWYHHHMWWEWPVHLHTCCISYISMPVLIMPFQPGKASARTAGSLVAKAIRKWSRNTPCGS